MLISARVAIFCLLLRFRQFYISNSSYDLLNLNTSSYSLLLYGLYIPIGLYFIMDLPGILLGMTVSYLICSYSFFQKLSLKENFSNNIKNNFSVLLHNFGVDFSTRAPRFVDKLVVLPILGSTNLGIYQLTLMVD